MVGLTGEQYEITGGGYRAVVVECGAGLRLLEHEGQPLLDGFGEDALPTAGRGQVLMPWPNRIRDGAYSFAGRELQLPLSEPKRHNASHGLVRWTAWTVEEHTTHTVSLTYRLMAQSGYPWTLDLQLLYDLSADGLTVTQTATNLTPAPAPYAAGMHPYLTVGGPSAGTVDRLELRLPAATRGLTDERKLPTADEAVEGTAYDFRVSRPVRDTVLDHAFTDLVRDERGRAVAELRDPVDGSGVALWVGDAYRWLQVYTGDDADDVARRSLAVEPMTAPADAFNSGRDLVTLSEAGAEGDEHSASWGLGVL